MKPTLVAGSLGASLASCNIRRHWQWLAGIVALVCTAQALAQVTTPDFSINNPSVVLAGGPESTGTMTFTITRGGNTTSGATVNFQTVQNGNALPNDDYTPLPLTPLFFPAGVTSQNVEVPVTVGEPEIAKETFGLELSNGSGSFPNGLTPLQLSGGNCIRLIGAAEGDLNDDGKPDLVVTCQSGYNAAAAAVFLNTTAPGSQTPTFSGPYYLYYQDTVTNSTTSGSIAVAIADINQDGSPDLVVADYNSTWVFLNKAKKLATTPDFAAAVMVANTGAGSGLSQALAIGDLNGDGKPDIATADGTNNVNVALNTTPVNGATPSFSAPVSFSTGNQFPPGQGTFGLKIGDLNGDNVPDIAAASYGTSGPILGAVTVFLNYTAKNASTPSFQELVNFNIQQNQFSVAIGDLNGDGLPDVIAVSREATISFFRNTGGPSLLQPDGGLTFTGYTLAVTEPVAITLGDVNGDGLLDVVLGDEGSGGAVLINKTTPYSSYIDFMPPIQLNTGSSGEDALIGDFNGDGLPDIAIPNLANVNSLLSVFTSQPNAAAESFTAAVGNTALVNGIIGNATIIIPNIPSSQSSSGAGGAGSTGAGGGSSSSPSGGGAVDPGLLAAWLGLLLLGRIRTNRYRGR